MPYAFTLPTTSSLFFSSFINCNSHPSLILSASTHRSILRNVLKTHKRLPIQSQSTNLGTILSALLDYIPYLSAIDSGLGGKAVSDEELDLILVREVEVEWRPSLAASTPGREPQRILARGLDYELCFVLNTLAYTYNLLARVQLRSLYAAVTPTPEQRTNAITTATKYLLQANSIHELLVVRTSDLSFPSAAIDVSNMTQGSLAALALAEATLLAVLKDDPYPAAVAQDRNSNDREWMIKAPDIPKVRAHLFARLCLAAAEHATRAYALLNGSKSGIGKGPLDSINDYARDLKRTSRAKACRFFGIDAELSGKMGHAIAWLNAGKKELGFKDDDSKLKGLSKFKKNWDEKREDRKIEKGGEWGSDAGRLEEARVIEMLAVKWNKINDTINVQAVPASDPLVANMPSGREMYNSKQYVLPTLDEDTLQRLRAPPEPGEEGAGSAPSDDSDDESKDKKTDVPGAFPQPSSESQSSYY
ncbi:MAG: hypothetical protein MMC33_002314 [Icmadophila ericetorum]|nr:hypothetical protein [Icmadophila ericetorum]